VTPPTTGWSALLDRMEERLRRLEAAATTPTGGESPDPGPEPTDADRPSSPPTADEHLRLLALLAAHDRVEARLRGRRRRLEQARRYQAGV
jgi:hypothetical protein